jgi:AcrR family transcriptional regulator
MTGQERRQQLLDIGRRLFAERGFEGTSIEEIAAQAGVSKPVVYEHFGGKEGLYAVVVDREVERLTTMTTMLFEGGHSRKKFEAAAVALLRYIEDNADGFRILVRDSNPGSGGGTYGTLLSDIAGQVEYIMADFLKSRGRDPKLAPMYSQMMVGMVAFTGQWWLDARKPRLEQVAANMIDLAWNGLSQLDARASRRHCEAGTRRDHGRAVLRRRRGQPRSPPRREAADHVGGTREPELVQSGRGQAGGVSLDADHDEPQVVSGHPGQPRVAAGIEPPLQVVPLDHKRSGDLASGGALAGRPDVDQCCPVTELRERLFSGQASQPSARVCQDFIDRPRTVRPFRHQSPAPSIPATASPPGVTSYLVIWDKRGE